MGRFRLRDAVQADAKNHAAEMEAKLQHKSAALEKTVEELRTKTAEHAALQDEHKSLEDVHVQVPQTRDAVPT